jgi:hypothetical protein
MAQKGGERRLLFDTRGRRRHVIRVVYAILAILMGTSLFLVIGPFNFAEILGTSTSGGEAGEVFEEQSERIEGRLAKDPKNEQQLLALTRARIYAGNASFQVATQGEVPTIDASAQDNFDAAAEAWSRYLKQAGGKANAGVAQLVAGTFFKVAEAAPGTPTQLEETIALAAKAQRIATEQRPSIGTLSTLAIYEYFNGKIAAGDEAAKQAAAKTSSKTQAKGLEKQLAEYRKRAVAFKKNSEQAKKQEQSAGGQSLQTSPFGLGAPAPGG